EAGVKPTGEPPAETSTPAEVRPDTPTSAPQGRSRDVSAIATPAKSPASAPPSRSGDVSAIVTPAKTLSSEPTPFLGKALTPEPPIPPRDVARESTPEKAAQPSQPLGDDVHDLVAQVAAHPPESVTVPTVSKWSLRRPTRRVFNIGQKYGKGKTGKFCKVLLLGAAVLAIGAALVKYFSMLKLPPPTAFCTTEDCAKFGLELRAAINPTADPCSDFHSFVCGGWG
ncbi:hypothetical protein MTO96_032900, partial [Rhipicephalus appendiculatus]